MAQRWSKPGVVIASVLVGVPLAFIAIQAVATLYDRNRVETMCARLVPGTSMSDARKIVEAAGVGKLLPQTGGREPFGTYDAKERNWFFAIPVEMEFGDSRCAIYNDQHVVLKAEMELL